MIPALSQWIINFRASRFSLSIPDSMVPDSRFAVDRVSLAAPPRWIGRGQGTGVCTEITKIPVLEVVRHQFKVLENSIVHDE